MSDTLNNQSEDINNNENPDLQEQESLNEQSNGSDGDSINGNENKSPDDNGDNGKHDDENHESTPLDRAYARVKEEKKSLKAQVDDLTQKLSEAESEIATFRIEKTRTEAAAKHGLPNELREFVKGEKEEDIDASAAKLAEMFKKNNVPFGVSHRQNNSNGSKGIGDFIKSQL